MRPTSPLISKNPQLLGLGEDIFSADFGQFMERLKVEI